MPAKNVNEEQVAESVSNSEERIDLEAYIAKANPHYGLVASFKVEASGTSEGLQPRFELDWKRALEAQSKKVYK